MMPKEATLIIEVDLLQEVILLIDEQYQVRDAFMAQGRTRHETQYPVSFYAYRKMLTPVGHCAVCGYTLDQINEPCSSSGGFHAFVGVAEDPNIPAEHKAENRNLPLQKITYDEFSFFIEPDNLFPIHGISQGMQV